MIFLTHAPGLLHVDVTDFTIEFDMFFYIDFTCVYVSMFVRLQLV